MFGLTLAQMGELVAYCAGRARPYSRATVCQWERAGSGKPLSAGYWKRQAMPKQIVEVYHYLIRNAVCDASGGRYVAHIQNKRHWRVTLRRVK